MNGTRAPFADQCGIILANGRDCPGYVHPDTPLNLCAEHLRAAYDWVARESGEVRNRLLCAICGQMTAFAAATGYHCENCGYDSPDLTKPMPLNPAGWQKQLREWEGKNW